MKYRLADTCPWPSRRGLTCTIVDPPTDGTEKKYPWPGLGSNEVVVLVDNDPYGDYTVSGRPWSCVLDRKHLEPL